jgi:hypothetical protein
MNNLVVIECGLTTVVLKMYNGNGVTAPGGN